MACSVVDGWRGLRWEIPSYDGGLLPDSLLQKGVGWDGWSRPRRVDSKGAVDRRRTMATGCSSGAIRPTPRCGSRQDPVPRCRLPGSGTASVPSAASSRPESTSFACRFRRFIRSRRSLDCREIADPSQSGRGSVEETFPIAVGQSKLAERGKRLAIDEPLRHTAPGRGVRRSPRPRHHPRPRRNR